jgi:hypothetical protein
VKEHKQEGTQTGTIVGAIGGHNRRRLQEEGLDFEFWGKPCGAEAHFLTGRVYQSGDCCVNKIL